MARVRANGVSLHGEVYGEGASLIGIHGSPGSALLWVEAAQQLARRGRCIVYDRRGYGRSEHPQPFESVDLDDHVEDTAALVDAPSAAPVPEIGRSTVG